MSRHTDEEVPQHPCLELVSNSEEKLTLLISRRLITMKKVAEYDPSYAHWCGMNVSKTEEYKAFTRQSIVSQQLSYSDLMDIVSTGVSSQPDDRVEPQRGKNALAAERAAT